MKIPTRNAISRMTDEGLEQTTEALEAWRDAIEAAGDPDDQVDEELLDALLAIEREQDARELWNSNDDRVREAVGNYTPARGHDDTPALRDVMATER